MIHTTRTTIRTTGARRGAAPITVNVSIPERLLRFAAAMILVLGGAVTTAFGFGAGAILLYGAGLLLFVTASSGWCPLRWLFGAPAATGA